MADDSHRVRWSPDASCAGKERFASRGMAERVAKRYRDRKRVTPRFTAYRCPFCAGYHVGNQPRRAHDLLRGVKARQQRKENHDG